VMQYRFSHPWSAFSRRVAGLAAFALAAGVLGSLASMAPAWAGVISPTVSSLSGTNQRLISYRHQEHMWITDDGVYHLLANRGAQTSGDSLQLYNSTDGITWTAALSLAGTGAKSTSDGSLSNGVLSVVYSGLSDEILFAPLKYDPTTQAWQMKGPGQTVRPKTPGGSAGATNPSLVQDRAGNFWVSFVEQDNVTGTSVLVLYYRVAGGNTWVNTGVTFGPQDALSTLDSPQRSARLVLTPNGIGVVYSVREGIFWQQRPAGGTPQDPWQAQQTLDPGDPNNVDTDPMASHFSLATDDQGYMHLAFVNAGFPFYLRYNAAANVLAWSVPATQLTSDSINAGYPQMSWMGGSQVALVVNAGSMPRLYQSASRGAKGSFVCTDRMTHPQATTDNGLNFDHPRIETPSKVPSGVSPMLMQYTKNGVQKAYAYSFDASSVAGCQ